MKPSQQIETPRITTLTDEAISPLMVWSNPPDFAKGLTWQQLDQLAMELFRQARHASDLEYFAHQERAGRVGNSEARLHEQECAACSTRDPALHCNHCDQSFCADCFLDHENCSLFSVKKDLATSGRCRYCCMATTDPQDPLFGTCPKCKSWLCTECLEEHPCNPMSMADSVASLCVACAVSVSNHLCENCGDKFCGYCIADHNCKR